MHLKISGGLRNLTFLNLNNNSLQALPPEISKYIHFLSFRIIFFLNLHVSYVKHYSQKTCIYIYFLYITISSNFI